jgi:L-ascorbate metabolism protein UlaG (beta-lactamase superfamily)
LLKLNNWVITSIIIFILTMQIIWKGQSCFQLTTQKNKTPVNIVVDPYGPEIGLRASSFSADIVLVTHDHKDHNNTGAISGQPFIITGPGEYEIKDVYIQGVTSWHDSQGGKERGVNTIYVIEAEDLKICHLGDLGQKELTDEQLEAIGEVDVLMVPVGGGSTISEKEAVKIISQIEPHITIPMHYLIPKLKVKLEGVEGFLKELGIKNIQPEQKLSIKKKDILPDEARIVVLEP